VKVLSRRRLTIAVGALFFALLAAKCALIAGAALEVQRSAKEVQSTVRSLQGGGGSADGLSLLGPELASLAGSLETLQSELRPLEPLLRATEPLPDQVRWISAVPDLLAFGTPLARAGATVAAPLASLDISDAGNGSRLPEYLTAAASLGPRASTLRQEFAASREASVRLPAERLSGPLASLAPAVAQASELLLQANDVLDLLSVIGPALGMDGPRTYMLLGQNNQEIRATGGFVGTAGSVTLENGAIARMDYGSSYTLDASAPSLQPPAPFARYLGLGGWYLRDANWWPDFPASAAQVELAWTRAGRPPVDGVIAFDLGAEQSLLRLVGPLEVPGYGQLTADNLEQFAAEHFYSESALAGQKAFDAAKNNVLGALGPVLVSRLMATPVAALPALGKQVQQLLSEKHVLLAFKDPQLLRLVHTRGWDGAIPDLAGDSLYLVDTNVSYGKTYPFVDSSAKLSVDIDQKGNLIHQLVLDYYNHYPLGLQPWENSTLVGGAVFDQASGTFRQIEGFWGNWLRIYLPPGACVLAVDGLGDAGPPQEEFGRLLVSGYLPLAPGERKAVQVRYVVEAGPSAADGHFRLFWQKQPGTDTRALSLTVRWPGGGQAGYQAALARDQWIELPQPK
jgi:hypothetical protein